MSRLATMLQRHQLRVAIVILWGIAAAAIGIVVVFSG
jgi:hypothetical protein